MKNKILGGLALVLIHTASFAQQQKKAVVSKASNAISAIIKSDLERDLYALASDHFKGREAGTLDELKASVWLAEQARAANLKPAGDDGTYFQFFSIWRNRLSENSSISIGKENIRLWKDAVLFQTAAARVDAPLVFVADANNNKIDVKGKAVALVLSTLNDSDPYAKSNPRRYILQLIRTQSAKFIEQGASAVFLVSDGTIDTSFFDRYSVSLRRGLYDIEGGKNERTTPKAPVFWLPQSFLELVKKPNQTANINLNVDRFEYPSVNVVAVAEGKDEKLKKEYVLYSGHQDHDGVRFPIKGDSIYNGADDNASVCVAMLAIGRAFKEKPAKRSALFVWHGAEERGLLGSRWYSETPTVPKKDIIAVLNADMIGKNHPDTAALLGVTPPHRNSTALVKAAFDANAEGPKFVIDSSWDAADHREGWYFRSDHLPYARLGYPAIFFSSLTHPDYHTPKDEANTIDYNKLLKVTQWMYLTGWNVANNNLRPAVDPNFKLER